jgi:hypothetical protein
VNNARVERIQERWLHGQNNGYDVGLLLEEVKSLREELEACEEERDSLLADLRQTSKELDHERLDHKTTHGMLEKAISELVAWRQKANAKARTS